MAFVMVVLSALILTPRKLHSAAMPVWSPQPLCFVLSVPSWVCMLCTLRA